MYLVSRTQITGVIVMCIMYVTGAVLFAWTALVDIDNIKNSEIFIFLFWVALYVTGGIFTARKAVKMWRHRRHIQANFGEFAKLTHEKRQLRDEIFNLLRKQYVKHQTWETPDDEKIILGRSRLGTTVTCSVYSYMGDGQWQRIEYTIPRRNDQPVYKEFDVLPIAMKSGVVVTEHGTVDSYDELWMVRNMIQSARPEPDSRPTPNDGHTDLM